METYTIEGPLELDVRLAAGDVEVVEGPDGAATVELTADGPGGQALIDEARVGSEPAGDGTRLLVHVPEHGGRPGRLRWLREDGVRIRVTVPPGTALTATVASADVTVSTDLSRATVTTASGDVAVRDVTGSLRVRSASGDVHAGGVGGTAEIVTASGDVRVGDVREAVTARTASGDVVTGRLAGDLDVRTVSGDVRVAEVAGGRTDTNSTSGDIDLTIAAGRRVHLDVASVSGELTSHLDSDVGGDPGVVDLELRARTVSGDVTLRRGVAARRRSHGVAIL